MQRVCLCYAWLGKQLCLREHRFFNFFSVVNSLQKESATGNVGGLTDASKYTGSHKERFDEEGKGKGKEGRVDKVDDSGYVGNYKGANTYDKK